MARTTIHVRLLDPELLERTAEEYAIELERVTDHCVACSVYDEPCVKHCELAADLRDNLTALALGMMKFG